MESKIEILEIYLHHLQKGRISITTFKMITQAIEQINSNEQQSANIRDAIRRDMQEMEKGNFDLFNFK